MLQTVPGGKAKTTATGIFIGSLGNPAPTYTPPRTVAPTFTPDAVTGLRTAIINGQKTLDPNDPNLKKKLAEMNPSGNSFLSAGIDGGGRAVEGFTPMGVSSNPDPRNTIDTQPYINDLFGQRDKALGLMDSQGLAQKKQLLLGFGSRELASSILGANDPFVSAINEDPNSGTGYLARHKFALNRNVFNADQQASVDNTYFGGGRAFALNDLNRGYLNDLYDQSQQVKNQLTGIDNQRASAALDWEQQIANAKRDLALRLMGAVS